LCGVKYDTERVVAWRPSASQAPCPEWCPLPLRHFGGALLSLMTAILWTLHVFPRLSSIPCPVCDMCSLLMAYLFQLYHPALELDGAIWLLLDPTLFLGGGRIVTSCVGLTHPRQLTPTFSFLPQHFLASFESSVLRCLESWRRLFWLTKFTWSFFGLEYSGVQVNYATSGILFWFVWLITVVNTTMGCYWYFYFIGMRLLFPSCPVSFTCSY
jgi:hypothetical protein